MSERAGMGCARLRAIGRGACAAFSLLALASAFASLPLDAAQAQSITLQDIARSLANLDRHALAQLALTLGILFFAATTAIALVRTRARMDLNVTAAKREIALLRDEADRAHALLLGDPQIIVVWREPQKEPL